MKKFLAILVLTFLFGGNANADVNEPGSGPIAAIENVKKRHYEHLAKLTKYCAMWTAPTIITLIGRI